jgi:phage major head subunit gpT-like protein
VQRPQGRISAGGGNELSGRDLELAVEASLMLELNKSASDLEAYYPESVLNAMDRHVELRNGLSLHDAMIFAAERNRVRVSRRDLRAMLQASFADVQASGASTFTLSGIFSNIANKFLKESFDFVESVWREISETASVRDFKTITSYSLTGDMTYEKVAPNGELKHATVGENSYTNRAETYGRMFSLSRTDIINDDLGALRAVPKRLGRGGALKLNDVFWAAFLDHGSFFTSGNKNLIGSGSSSPWYLLCDPMDLAMIQVVFLNGRQMPTVEQADAEFKQLGIQFRGYHDFGVALQEPRAAIKSPATLDLAGLAAGNKLFLDQTDRDGKKLALTPRILLTSTANADTALELMRSPLIVTGNTAKGTNTNVFAGRYRPLTSAYLTNV